MEQRLLRPGSKQAREGIGRDAATLKHKLSKIVKHWPGRTLPLADSIHFSGAALSTGLIIKDYPHQRLAKVTIAPQSVRSAGSIHFFFHLPYFGSQTFNASSYATPHGLYAAFQISHDALDASDESLNLCSLRCNSLRQRLIVLLRSLEPRLQDLRCLL